MYDETSDNDIGLAYAPSQEMLALLVGKLSKDVLDHAARLSMPQIRGLVDTYYQIQEFRKAAASQQRAVEQGADDNPLIAWVLGRILSVEKDITKIMDVATTYHAPSVWARSLVGVGPVLSAGLLAHVDVTRAPTPSALHRFAGYDPTQTWLGKVKATALVKEYFPKGILDEVQVGRLAEFLNRKPDKLMEMATDRKTGKTTLATLVASLSRRPWNAQLKVLAYKCGQSFMKFMNHPNAPVYSDLYRQRKALELQRNAEGFFTETARQALEEKTYAKDTEAYKAYSVGRLPAGRIDARARRYAVKIFLVHFWQVCYETHYKKKAPGPYIIEHNPRHTHLIEIPNWPL